ncbi:MAG: response regulator [Lachnospiraceae bacterium]|nr:response regulator [Lachnospiraceae bacterium]
MERFGMDRLKNILGINKVGLWIYEQNGDSAPRMYFDDNMKDQCGIREEMSPEDLYTYWYSRICDGYEDLIKEGLSSIASREHAEVLYEWNHPEKGPMFVRTGGLIDKSYSEGTRTEGFQQDVTDIIHIQKEQYEKQISQIRESSRVRSIIAGLANDYDYIGHISFPDNSLKTYRSTSKFLERMQVTDALPANSAVFRQLIEDNTWPEDHERFIRKGNRNTILQEINHNDTYQFDFRLAYRGEPEYYRIKYVKSNDEKDSLIVGITNIDQQVKAREKEAALQESIRQATRENEAKTSFLFNMSHDIRTPMNAITGYTAMAKKYVNYPDRVTDYLEKIDISGQQLLRLINQVLDMSRIEANKVVINEEALDIVTRFDDVLTIVDSTARNAGIRLKGVIKNITNRTVYCDDLRMNQVILNILGNAVKYTRPGGMVTATLEQLRSDDKESGCYKITVADTGIGMSEEFLDKIFDEFSRERNSTSSKIEGTGLGMSIVKKLLDALGGTIDIKSTPGKGTTVSVVINFRLADEESVPIRETTQADTDILNGKRVLLVEDNEMNREIARSILEEFGMIVFEAEDGDIAVRKVEEAEAGYYDYVLMDVQMPRMNGFEATRAIRELPDKEKSGLPIIAMTANAFSEDKQRVLASGMDAHLPKPIDITDLVITLGRFART